MTSFQVGSQTLIHNLKKWDVMRNRHTTTSGNPWGWIEGADGNVCWSEDGGASCLTLEQARNAVVVHNEWLENQTPTGLRIVSAECTIKQKEAVVKRCEATLELAKRDLYSAIESMQALQSRKTALIPPWHTPQDPVQALKAIWDLTDPIADGAPDSSSCALLALDISSICRRFVKPVKPFESGIHSPVENPDWYHG